MWKQFMNIQGAWICSEGDIWPKDRNLMSIRVSWHCNKTSRKDSFWPITLETSSRGLSPWYGRRHGRGNLNLPESRRKEKELKRLDRRILRDLSKTYPSNPFSPTRSHLLITLSTLTHQWINILVNLRPSGSNHFSRMPPPGCEVFNIWPLEAIIYPSHSRNHYV